MASGQKRARDQDDVDQGVSKKARVGEGSLIPTNTQTTTTSRGKKRTADEQNDDQASRKKRRTTKTTPEEVAPFRFKDLPAELRNKVYGHVLQTDKPMRPKLRDEKWERFDRFNILEVDKQLHNEAKHILHAECTLALTVEHMKGLPEEISRIRSDARDFEHVKYSHRYDRSKANMRIPFYESFMITRHLKEFILKACPSNNPESLHRRSTRLKEQGKQRSFVKTFWQRQRNSVRKCAEEAHEAMRAKRDFCVDLHMINHETLEWRRENLVPDMIPMLKLATEHGWTVTLNVGEKEHKAWVRRKCTAAGIDKKHLRLYSWAPDRYM